MERKTGSKILAKYNRLKYGFKSSYEFIAFNEFVLIQLNDTIF